MSTDRMLSIFADRPPDTSEPSAPPATDEHPPAVEPAPKPVRVPKLAPSRSLPPSRIGVAKQLEILRGHVIASKAGAEPVGNVALAQAVGMHQNNVSLVNPFFISVGLIIRSGGGFLPSQEAIEYHRACDWDQGHAGVKMAPLLRGSWFGEIVLNQLQLKQSRPDHQIVLALATAAQAPADAKSSLHMLLEYLRVAGVITIEDGMVRAARPQAGEETDVREAQPTDAAPAPAQPPPPAHGPATPSSPAKGADATGQGVRFSIDLTVTMQEMAGWAPDRISAFFSGLAQVITAKGASHTGG